MAQRRYSAAEIDRIPEGPFVPPVREITSEERDLYAVKGLTPPLFVETSERVTPFFDSQGAAWFVSECPSGAAFKSPVGMHEPAR